jgi:hypothetical protein
MTSSSGFLGTCGEFAALPGVLEVKCGAPRAGYVTLVVEPGAAGIGQYLDPGQGDGRGVVPIGLTVVVEVRT